MTEDPITNQEQAEADQFYGALGRAIAKWSMLEHCMARIFHRAISTTRSEDFSSSIFHSARSWRARYDMLSAALANSTDRPCQVRAWQAILKKANDYSIFRNRIAHESVRLHLGASDSMRTLMIVPNDANDESAHDLSQSVTREQVEIAAENFQLLISLALHALDWDDEDQLGAPERSLMLVDQLPSQAHSTRTSQSVAAQIALGLERFPFPE
jgi:hypothetical protein